MKKLFLLLLLLGGSCLSYAQGMIVWDKFVHTRPDADEELKTAIQSKSGKFWVGVSNMDYDTSYHNFSSSSALAFKDSNGDTLWYRNFHQDYPLEANGWGIAHGANGHFWVVIKYRWNNIVPDQTGIAVYEFDSLGQQLQHREFMQGCNNFKREAVYSHPDGGLVIVGHINRTTISNCTQNDLFALRLDSEGNQVWQQIYQLSGSQSMRTSGLYPGGKIAASYATSGNNENRMAFIDLETGALLYTKAAPSGTSTGMGYALRTWPLRDGSFIVGGSNVYPPTTSSGYLARTDANFNILWQRNDPQADIYGDCFSAETKDSCVIVVSANHNYGSSGAIFMAKVRLSDGQELWRKYFAYSEDTSNFSGVGVSALIVSTNGDLYPIGSLSLPNVTNYTDFYMARYTGVADFLQPSDYCTDSLQANFTGSWVGDTLRLYNTSNSGMALQDSVDCQWLIGGSTVSIDTAINMQISPAAHPNGLPVTLVITNFWGCKDTLTATVTPQGIVGNKPVQKGVFVGEAYPNPASNSVSINYGLPSACKSAVVRMSEVGTGKVLIEQEMSLTDNALRLNTAPLAAGMYVLQVYADGAPLGVRKVSVVK